MVYNKKTQRKRSKSASKSRRRRSRGGDIEDGEPDHNVAELMKPPNRSISPTNFPPPSYAETMKMYPRRSSPSLSTKIFDKYDAAEKGEAGSNLVGGKRRKGRRSARRGKRSKKTRNGKRSTKKKSLFGKLFGL